MESNLSYCSIAIFNRAGILFPRNNNKINVYYLECLDARFESSSSPSPLLQITVVAFDNLLRVQVFRFFITSLSVHANV